MQHKAAWNIYRTIETEAKAEAVFLPDLILQPDQPVGSGLVVASYGSAK
ncbi:hypothetical protein [Rhizobium grahamii]|nr:hypothetical protein [Rhizobium grahamii]